MPRSVRCREYAKATGLTQQYVVVQPLVTLSVTGVCLWVAIKFLANPGYVPSSLYMARATGEHGVKLSHARV